MGNKINWTADEVRMDYHANVLRAMLTGKPEQAPFVGTLTDIHHDLQTIIRNGMMLTEPVTDQKDASKTLNISKLLAGTSVCYSSIKKVIFNDPATIVIWRDDTKTVVKAVNEPFDPEKGLAMAIAKKAFGNQGNYYNEISRWTEGYALSNLSRKVRPLTEKEHAEIRERCAKLAEEAKEYLRELGLKHMSNDIKSDISSAYKALSEVASRKTVTKAQMQAAMEEAIGYLGHVLAD